MRSAHKKRICRKNDDRDAKALCKLLKDYGKLKKHNLCKTCTQQKTLYEVDSKKKLNVKKNRQLVNRNKLRQSYIKSYIYITILTLIWL